MVLLIADSQTNDLPIQDNMLFKKYFSCMEEKWLSPKRGEWYYSFSRRLIQKRGGISQFEQVVETLVKDPKSRRCVLHANDISDNSEYRPALIAVTFLLDEYKLNMIAHWRSQELLYALPINVLEMCSLLSVFTGALGE